MPVSFPPIPPCRSRHVVPANAHHDFPSLFPVPRSRRSPLAPVAHPVTRLIPVLHPSFPCLIPVPRSRPSFPPSFASLAHPVTRSFPSLMPLIPRGSFLTENHRSLCGLAKISSPCERGHLLRLRFLESCKPHVPSLWLVSVATVTNRKAPRGVLGHEADT